MNRSTLSERYAALASAPLAATLLLLCGPETGLGQAANDLSRVLEWQDTVTLEESAEVLNVLYNVDLDASGGFLVSDSREGQFRRYDSMGRLLWFFGRRGGGPAEFGPAVRAIRLRGEPSHVALLDRTGKVAVYDDVADSLVSTARLGFARVHDVAPSEQGTLWVATGLNNPERSERPELFHLVDAYSGATVTQIPGPRIAPDQVAVAMYMNWSGISEDPISDTLWAVVATRDTIYGLSPGSRQIVRRIPLRSRLVRPLTGFSTEEFDDRLARRQWAEKQSYLTDVFPLVDGRFVVLFQDFRNGLPVWGFLLMDREGAVEFEVNDTHRLLTVDPAEGLLVFQDRNALEGNRWLIGRLR